MSSSGGYRRVRPSEESTASELRQRTRSERIVDKIYAMGWLTLAFLVAGWTNFFHTLVSSDSGVNRPTLYLAAVFLGINIVLLLYLTVYLPKVVGITDSSAWDVYCPRIVPAMCLGGVLFGILLIRATWPVWGFLAPLIFGIEAMGALFSLHFAPWF